MTTRETTKFTYDGYGRVDTKTVEFNTVDTTAHIVGGCEQCAGADAPTAFEPLSCTEAFDLVMEELARAGEKFDPFSSAHEGWAVLQEEMDELWDEVKANDGPRQRNEAVQVAAMAVRFLIDQRVAA